MFLNRDPPYQKKTKKKLVVFHEGWGWNFGTERKCNPSTGNGKGPEAKKEDCKDQPRKKRISFKVARKLAIHQKQDNTKTHSHEFKVNSQRFIFFWWFFCS